MKKTLLLLIFVVAFTSSNAQSRKFLRDKIQEWGECKNVAMTLTGGDVALKRRNGYACSGVPRDMANKLDVLNSRDVLIDDIELTESGGWLILWGDNGVTSYNIPNSLNNKISQWNNAGEVINSITFNDSDEWIMISDKKYSASDSRITNWLQAGENEYGELWAAHMTNTGLVAVYERGYRFLGDVPYSLRSKLTQTDINVYRVKFLKDGCYFIADKNGRYAYNM